MPATPLTIECRAAAVRMIHVSNLSGNAQVMHKMTYEDSASFNALRGVIEAGGAPAQMIADLALATQRISNVIECEGVVALHPVLTLSVPAVLAACDFADGLAAGERTLGITAGMNREVDPLCMVTPEFAPITIEPGDEVRITNTNGWSSIEGLWFPATLVHAGIGQFTLTGADTTNEAGIGADATATIRTPP